VHALHHRQEDVNVTQPECHCGGVFVVIAKLQCVDNSYKSYKSIIVCQILSGAEHYMIYGASCHSVCIADLTK